MQIEDLVIERRGFYIDLRKVRAYHASNFKIDKLRVSMENDNVDILISIKNVSVYDTPQRVVYVNFLARGTRRLQDECPVGSSKH